MLYICVGSVCVVLLILIIKFYLSTIQIVNLSKRCVFITGCDTGFGHLLACTLDTKGVVVIAGCLTEKGAAELEKKTSSRLKTVIVDVTDKESVKRAFEFTRDQTKELWAVVNNAGVLLTYGPSEWTSLEQFEDTCKVNLFGTVAVTLAFLPLLRKSKGRLVNVCSVSSNCAFPSLTSYVTSKAAVKMFSTCMRRELFNTGITVHTIEPGAVQTEMAHKNRLFDTLVKAFRNSDYEKRQYYGGDIAEYLVGGVKLTAKLASSKPQNVIDAMAHALLAKYPKRRYLVGPDAQLFFRFLSVLPERAVDYILGWPKPYGELSPDLQKNKMLSSWLTKLMGEKFDAD